MTDTLDMAPPWFRFWIEAPNNPKVLTLTAYDFRSWVLLLCQAAKGKPRGYLPKLDACAKALGVRPLRLEDTLKRLKAAGLLDSEDGAWKIHDWDKWQAPSDHSTPRVQKHREKVASEASASDQNGTQHVHNAYTVSTEHVQRVYPSVHDESRPQADLRPFETVSETALDTDTDTDSSYRATKTDYSYSPQVTITTNTNSTGSISKAAATATPATPSRPPQTRPAAIFPKLDVSFVSLWIEEHELPRPTRGIKSIATVLNEYKDLVSFNLEGALMSDWLKKPENANKTFDAGFVRNWFDTAIKKQSERGTTYAARDSHSNTTQKTTTRPADVQASNDTGNEYTDDEWLEARSVRRLLRGKPPIVQAN